MGSNMGELMVEMSLVVNTIADRTCHFQGFPFLLDLIESRVFSSEI